MNYGKRSTTRKLHSVDAKSTKKWKRAQVIICKFLLVCIVVGGVVGGSAALGVYQGIIDSSPDMSRYDVVPTGYSTTVLDSAGNQTATLVASGANRKYATLDQIPEHMQHAFVAIEDSRFYEHNGIDPYGILRAFVKGLSNGLHFSQGASTITQQLIKNNVLTTWTGETTQIERFQRKIQEQYLAIQLEKQVKDKDWILENYLNTINLGSNTLGVQAASLRYFGKDVSELTLSESAVIAGVTKNPYAYNPILYPEDNAKRRVEVLNAMLKQKYITQTEYDEALADDVYSRIAEHNITTSSSTNSYFVDALIDQLEIDLTDLGYTESEAYKLIYQGGLTIESTQDSTIQQVCDEEVNNEANYPFVKYSFFLYFQVKQPDGAINSYTETSMVRYYQDKTGNKNFGIDYNTQEGAWDEIHMYEEEMCSLQGGTLVEGSESVSFTLQPQVALTLIDQNTGYVKALCGGRGDKETDRGWNRATKTTRQPGSCFKIIGCYVAALDAGGKTLGSVVDDAPLTVGTKEFNNYDFVYHGWTNIREAIISSINITTVKNLQDIGVELSYQYATRMGITTLTNDDKNLALALGGVTYGVKNIDLTCAYATIANGGTYREPILYTRVLDHDGNVLIDRTETQEVNEHVLKESTSFLLTSAMSEVLTKGTGTLARFASDMPQAGKSGTTTNNRDTVWAAYTPYYTCAVWGGYDDNAVQNDSSVAYPKHIWRNIMQRIHADLPVIPFNKPDTIEEVQICSESGLLAVEGLCDQDPRGSKIITEYFDKDTVPTTTCDHHVKLRICNDSGQIANNYCPSTSITEKVFIKGSSPETQDAEVLAPSNPTENTCTKHNASTNKAQTGNDTNKKPGNTTGGTGNTGTTGNTGNTDNTGNGGNTGGTSGGSSNKNPSDGQTGSDTTGDGAQTPSAHSED